MAYVHDNYHAIPHQQTPITITSPQLPHLEGVELKGVITLTHQTEGVVRVQADLFHGTTNKHLYSLASMYVQKTDDKGDVSRIQEGWGRADELA
jgi:hypothetical protein